MKAIDNKFIFKSSMKTFNINWDKVNTIEDIKVVLKGLNFIVNLDSNKIPENLKDLYDKGYLKEKS